MPAEVIAIGDELTSGQRLDTNSQWLSQRLGELGLRVGYHSTVGDDLDASIDVFRTALRRADVILCTGGLGPTADDLTRQGLAAAAGVELVLDKPSLEHIRQLFHSRRREMPPQNEIQAMFPAGSQVVPNPHGTAPGIDFTWQDSRLFALPGVPAEMKEMWEQSVAPALLERRGDDSRVIRHRVIKCFGVGESDLEQRLPDLVRRGRSPSVGITVHKATITLRITAAGPSEEHCSELIGPTEEIIHQCLGPLVFGDEDDELEDAVVRLLRRHAGTVWVLENGTGGLVSDWLAVADPRGEVFRGGDIDRTMPSDAETIKQRMGDVLGSGAANHVLAVGPFPEPPGRVLLGLGREGAGVEIQKVTFAGHPDILRERCAKQALDRLRMALLEES